MFLTIINEIFVKSEKAVDLISRMAIAEKISQMIVFAAAIPRLGIPKYNWWHEVRTGHGQETAGEDPFLTSEYVYALIDGLQRGDDDRYLKIAADCKHYAAYDLENSNGTSRTHFNAIVSDQDLVETIIVGHNYTRTPEDSARESSSYK